MTILQFALITLGLYASLEGLYTLIVSLFLLARGVRTNAIIYVSEKGRFIRYWANGVLQDFEYRPTGGDQFEPGHNEDSDPALLNSDILYNARHPRFYVRYTFASLIFRPLSYFLFAFVILIILKHL